MFSLMSVKGDGWNHVEKIVLQINDFLHLRIYAPSSETTFCDMSLWGKERSLLWQTVVFV